MIDQRDAMEEYFRKHGLSPNGKTEDGLYYLVKAVQAKAHRCLEGLLEMGGSVNKEYIGITNNRQLIHMAARDGHVETLRILHAFGADLNAKDNEGMTPLMLSINGVKEHAIDKVRFLLSHVVDVDAINNQNGSALTFAVVNDRMDIVNEMIAAGAIVRDKDIYLSANDKFKTLLMAAARRNALLCNTADLPLVKKRSTLTL